MSREFNDKQLDAIASGLQAGEPIEKVLAGVPRPKVRMKNNNEESRMQRYLVKWFAANCRRWNLPHIALFSIPNGGNWDARRGSIMKAEGQKKGVPDLMLAAGHYRYKPVKIGQHMALEDDNCHGLFLELKTETGRLSPEQIEYHAFLLKQGYKVLVCRSTEEAIKAIEEYLK